MSSNKTEQLKEDIVKSLDQTTPVNDESQKPLGLIDTDGYLKYIFNKLKRVYYMFTFI